MKNVNYIIKARHYSPDGASARGYIEKQKAIAEQRSGVSLKLDYASKGKPVHARIWQGQWVADCDVCNNCMFVDPEDPIFFCTTCGNLENSSAVRPVVFPANWREIEKVLLLRPVDDRAGLNEKERAGLARPLLALDLGGGNLQLLTRSWNPPETLDDLHAQQDTLIQSWKKKTS